jgi:hypothetical protein
VLFTVTRCIVREDAYPWSFSEKSHRVSMLRCDTPGAGVADFATVTPDVTNSS